MAEKTNKIDINHEVIHMASMGQNARNQQQKLTVEGVKAEPMEIKHKKIFRGGDNANMGQVDDEISKVDLQVDRNNDKDPQAQKVINIYQVNDPLTGENLAITESNGSIVINKIDAETRKNQNQKDHTEIIESVITVPDSSDKHTTQLHKEPATATIENISNNKPNDPGNNPKRSIVINMAKKSHNSRKESQNYAVRLLDNFHRKNVENFKAPFEYGSVGSFIQYDINFDEYDPKYSLNMRNYFNTQYTAQIAVGDSGNLFSFILDTGSGTTQLAANSCKSSGCQSPDRNRFDAKTSPNWISEEKIVKIGYAKGAVLIELGSDNMFFEDLLISHQEFGIVLEEKSLFKQASYDGILGLSYPALSDQTKPIFDRIIELGIQPHNQFAICLGRNANIENQSKFYLGGFDTSCIEDGLGLSDINYHPVVKKTWWTLNLDKVQLRYNGKVKDTELCSEFANEGEHNKCMVIMDTGSSLQATPPDMLSPLQGAISSYSTCNNQNGYPDMIFVIDGIEYVLEPYEYIQTEDNSIEYDPTYANGSSNGSINRTDTFCSFGVSVFNVGRENIWIAGDIFLTKYFSIYDRDNDRVGLVKANKGTTQSQKEGEIRKKKEIDNLKGVLLDSQNRTVVENNNNKTKGDKNVQEKNNKKFETLKKQIEKNKKLVDSDGRDLEDSKKMLQGLKEDSKKLERKMRQLENRMNEDVSEKNLHEINLENKKIEQEESMDRIVVDNKELDKKSQHGEETTDVAKDDRSKDLDQKMKNIQDQILSVTSNDTKPDNSEVAADSKVGDDDDDEDRKLKELVSSKKEASAIEIESLFGSDGSRSSATTNFSRKSNTSDKKYNITTLENLLEAIDEMSSNGY